jgi:hypothetical protein
MQSFIQTNVQLATWRATPCVEQVSVRFARRLSGEIVCSLEASRADRSSVSASGFAAQAFGAIQSAARRLEVALFPPLPPRNDGLEDARAVSLAA